MSIDIIGLAGLAAVLCFVVALGGSARAIVWAVIGVAVALLSALLMPNVVGYTAIVGAIVIGGAAGTIVAKKVKTEALDKIFDLFRALSGLSAALVSMAALLAPAVHGIGTPGTISVSGLIEMGLAAAFGSLVFAGSLTLFAKRQGLIGSNQALLPMAFLLKAGLVAALALPMAWLAASESLLPLVLLIAAAAGLGYLLIQPASDEDLPMWAALLNAGLGLAAACLGFLLANTLLVVAGGLAASVSMALGQNGKRSLVGFLSGK